MLVWDIMQISYKITNLDKYNSGIYLFSPFVIADNVIG